MNKKIMSFKNFRTVSISEDLVGVSESTPPGMEDWVKANKERFKKEYGSDYERILYATAWKMHKESTQIK